MRHVVLGRLHGVDNFFNLGLERGQLLLGAILTQEGGLSVPQLGPKHAHLRLKCVAPELEAVLLPHGPTVIRVRLAPDASRGRHGELGRALQRGPWVPRASLGCTWRKRPPQKVARARTPLASPRDASGAQAPWKVWRSGFVGLSKTHKKKQQERCTY
ncbi:hypothetical protein D1007_00702 [Hordeum vulgare]|nr:hypothetical protein D1007_00702 [Hordeum vulgare]